MEFQLSLLLHSFSEGGDVSFVRHLTVRDNTDGRNHAIWARNRRSDDYEIMCKDGRRLNVDRFEECHLGYIPSNAIVTSGRPVSFSLVEFDPIIAFDNMCLIN